MDKKYSSNNLGKTLLVCGSVILESLIFNGCKAKVKYSPSRQEPPKETQKSKYEFTHFGAKNFRKSLITQVELADVDGDGDKDIIIGTKYGNLIIYENKMPQKNK